MAIKNKINEMKLVILAGGMGSRFIEETVNKPKPMITIGGLPIILHIMNYYSFYGVRKFIICSGYKGEQINSFFTNLVNDYSDIKIDIKDRKVQILNKPKFDWSVTIIKSDEHTETAGRLLSIKKYLNKNEDFFFTYGDGLSNINLKKQLKYFKSSKKSCLMTGVRMANKYGIVKEKNNNIINFDEKKTEQKDRINGGFFILNYKIFNFLKNKRESFEKNIINKLITNKEICLYKHDDFWQSMDNIRERNYLEELWNKNSAPWKVW